MPDAISVTPRGEIRAKPKHASFTILQDNSCMRAVPITAAAFYRLLETGLIRQTEDGRLRVLEAA